MALTALDPSTALIIIDLQKGLVGMPTVHPMTDIVRRSVELADAFRRHGLPVVLVNVAGGADSLTATAVGSGFGAITFSRSASLVLIRRMTS